MAMQIKVTRTSGKILDEDNRDIESRKAKYRFSAQLSNVGEKSIYDGVVVLTCNCAVGVESHDADLVLDRTDTYSACFRLSCPMHPGDRERKISWNVIGQPFPDIVGVEKTRIKFEFKISAKDSQTETLVTEFDGHDRDGQEKDAERLTQ